MREGDAERLAPLLEQLRARPELREERPTVFSFKGREILDFHADRGSLVADLRLGRGFLRLPAATPDPQSELLERIDEKLAPSESRAERRRHPRRLGNDPR